MAVALVYKFGSSPYAYAMKFDFAAKVKEQNLDLSPLGVDTLQVNLTKLCNQACHHCHVDASPKRTEQMSRELIDRCLEILKAEPGIKHLDLTGGAPELHPDFDYFVESAVALKKKVLIRHNLTVTLDGNPVTKQSKAYLPEFFAKNELEVISSLPCYGETLTDKQRGAGVFEKSIESLKRLNQVGYGKPESKLVLNLVYNPVGEHLPPAQPMLEAKYKEELSKNFGITFNSLFTITNMPIHRMKKQLEKTGGLDAYLQRLSDAFNPRAAEGIMCRSLVSVSFDGKLYDCDFNQMLEMPITLEGKSATLWDWSSEKLGHRKILFDSHCFGCTAGAGSSCGGATT